MITTAADIDRADNLEGAAREQAQSVTVATGDEFQDKNVTCETTDSCELQRDSANSENWGTRTRTNARFPRKTGGNSQSGAESGALGAQTLAQEQGLDAALAIVVSAWQNLAEGDRKAILAIVLQAAEGAS